MEKHVTILGVLYIAFGALSILAAVIIFMGTAAGGLLSNDKESFTLLTGIGTIIAFFLVILAVPGIIGGIGLLMHMFWAKILVLVLGFLNLLNFPFGSILGVYTIWVLMKDETDVVFRRGEVHTSV